MIIESGGSNATAAVVSEEGRLHTLSVGHEVDFHANLHGRTYWSMSFEAISPTGADDYFFYFKNTGTATYCVPDIRIETDSACVVEVHWVTGTASATSAVTPVNRYLGASPVITGTIGTAVNITGLSNAGNLAWIDLPVVNTQYDLNLASTIIIPPGQAFALMDDTGGAPTFSAMISVFEIE